MESTSVRFIFEDVVAAAQALVTILTDARKTTDSYRFHGLSVNAVMQSGLVLEGEVQKIAASIAAIPGTTRYDE